MQYVRKHLPEWRQSGRFKAGIHEPALLTLKLSDLEHAVYVEKEAGGQQLEAFVCEAATEANDLMQELQGRFSKVQSSPPLPPPLPPPPPPPPPRCR